MNNKPNIPEELLSGKGYARVVNAWSWIGTLIAVVSEFLLHYYKDWHVALRAMVALAPLFPALFWLQSYARWIRGMDELHRRIELAACLFATTTTLFLFMTLHSLDKAGIFHALGFHESWVLDLAFMVADDMVDDLLLLSRLRHLQPPLQMKFMKCNSKYALRMIIGLTGYVLGLAALNHFDAEHLPHRYWLVLLPLLPMLYLVDTIIRHAAELDEMWRKIVTEAMAFSGLAAGFTCFTYLFLRDMGAPEFRAEWAFYLMWAYYGIGAFFSWRRYQ